MATETSCSIFNEEKIRAFRIIHMTYFEARDVLYHVYRWGTQEKDPNQPLQEFLKELGYSNTKLRNCFTDDQRELIAKDPLGESYDITLLVIVISMACKGLRRPIPWVPEETEDTLKKNIIDLRDFRNSCAHRQPLSISEGTFKEDTEYLRERLKSILENGAELYKIDKEECDKIVKATEVNLDKSRDDPVEHQKISQYIVNNILVENQKDLLGDGKAQLKEKYKFFSSVSPASFFTGKGIHVNVDLVFTPMEIIESGTCKLTQDETLEIEAIKTVDYQDIIEFTQNSTINHKSKTDILLIEGIAGSGKTTLTKLMMSQWQNNHSSMQHLLDYDLLIYFECRNSAIHSFTQLLETWMPNIVPRFKEGNLMKCACTLKLLIIADGLDELNETSTKVFQEILDIGSMTVVTIICTSRPEYVKKFYSLKSPEQYVTHVKLNGIPKTNREEFVCKYHEELKNTGVSKHNTQNLLAYLQASSQHLEGALHLPLNLVWLTIMWSLNPDHMNNITNAAELYTEILNLKRKLLLNKLAKTDIRYHQSAQVEANIDKFITHLSWEALVNLKDRTLDSLTDDCVCRLRDTCSSLDLPHEPTLSAFLVENITHITTRSKSSFSFDHKGEQDYLAANYLIQALNGHDLRFDITSIVRAIQSHPSFQNESLRPEFTRRIMNFLESTTHMKMSQATATDQQIGNGTADSDTDPKPTTVNGVLEGLYGANRIPSDLSQYQNMFTYMAGLIHQVPEIIRPQVTDEIVYLFKQSGVNDKDQWIHLMKELQCDQDITKSIASNVPNLVSGYVSINDTQVDQYSRLLPYATQKRVSINMENNVNDEIDFEMLMNGLSDKTNCPVHLFLHYHFRNATAMNLAIEEKLQRVLECCQVQRYMGRLSGTNMGFLPRTMERLWLAIDNSNEETTTTALKNLPTTSSLRTLNVHVTPSANSSLLIPLPGNPELLLYISNVDYSLVEWTTTVAERLQPKDGSMEFTNILFPRCQLNTEEFKVLLERMSSHGVKVSGCPILGGVAVSSKNIPTMDYRTLQEFTLQTMKCCFRLQEEDKIWPKIVSSSKRKS